MGSMHGSQTRRATASFRLTLVRREPYTPRSVSRSRDAFVCALREGAVSPLSAGLSSGRHHSTPTHHQSIGV